MICVRVRASRHMCVLICWLEFSLSDSEDQLGIFKLQILWNTNNVFLQEEMCCNLHFSVLVVN